MSISTDSGAHVDGDGGPALEQVADWARRFELIPTATVSDVMERLGIATEATMALDIGPLRAGQPLAGPAYTVRWVRDPRRPTEWNPPGVRRVSSLFAPITPGDVVVVDGGGDRTCGHWGEMLSMMARRHGGRGVVVAGGTRDSAAILALDGWAAFTRYTSPIESIGRMRIHELDVPI